MSLLSRSRAGLALTLAIPTLLSAQGSRLKVGPPKAAR